MSNEELVSFDLQLQRARNWYSAKSEAERTGGGDVDYGAAPEEVARARAFQQSYYSAGLVGADVPVEYGGLGLSREQAWRLAELEEQALVPDRKLFLIGMGMCIPTLLRHGDDSQKAHYIPRILRGDDIWCQLFSEPGAGSDLASISTKAQLQPDGSWKISGQKVWTSHARAADLGLLIARSDPASQRHGGLSVFALPLRRPGVTVRPLKQITGDADFNEVFLEDVCVPAENLIGGEGNGWQVAATTLKSERLSLSGSSRTVTLPTYQMLRGLSQSRAVSQTVDVALAEYASDKMAFEALERIMRAWKRQGVDPELMGSVAKLVSSRLTRQGNEHAANLSLRTQNTPGDRSEALLRSRNASIAGGTDNIQRNILARRVLGLPR